MGKSLILPFCVALIFVLLNVFNVQAVTAQKFEPLKDTLARYNVVKIPEPSDYPDVPAVGLLSITEYNQIGTTHERKIHRIVKILTAAGKEHTRVRIPCFGSCRLDGRTIKPDGTIVNLPSRDLIRSEKITQYSAPYTFLRFALPAVEPGDIIEYKATIELPFPFYLDDYSFSEVYPLVKSVFILTHPDDYSYFYQRLGTAQISTNNDQFLDGQIKKFRTMFSVDNVKAEEQEPYAPDTSEGQPRIRLVMNGHLGEKLEIFKNWFEYGTFVADRSRIPSIAAPKVAQFVREIVGKETSPAVVIPKIFRKADQEIQIVNKTIIQSGFEFQAPEDTLEKKIGTPHDFAIFLAECFKFMKWDSELALVNSHNRPAASKENAFPLDLDMVFLNVKTANGEFLLDCSGNGMPPGLLSSAAMNRFALVIPVGTEVNTRTMSPYLTTMLYRDGNKTHMDFNLVAAKDVWNIDFKWYLGGELQKEWIEIYRQEGDSALKRAIAVEARTRIHADQIQQIEYSFVGNGIEVKGRGTARRSKTGPGMEAVVNDFWDPVFTFKQFLFDGRTKPILLPIAGELSSTVTIQLEPGMEPVLPASADIQCTPLKYLLQFSRQGQQLRIQENLTAHDMLIKQSLFPKFAEFLDRYQSNHFWMILMSPNFQPSTPLPMQKLILAFMDPGRVFHEN